MKAVIRVLIKQDYEDAKIKLFGEKIKIKEEHPELLALEIDEAPDRLQKLKSKNPHWFFYLQAVIRVNKHDYDKAKKVLLKKDIKIEKEYRKLDLFIIEIAEENLKKLKSEHPEWFFYRGLCYDDL